ncbi:MAG: OmpA family protein [Pyrinomonadaceae bacterium]
MSEDKKIPSPPPPDDFSKTTPNINIPADVGGGAQNDWDKTNYNFPKQPVADDWGKTVTNIKPINTDQQDFGKTMYPGAKAVPNADWGVTNTNINVSPADFGSGADDFGGAPDKTTPYFSLPEAERAKYQNLPPTPTEQAAQVEKEKEEKGGIPGWFWISAGLLTMLFFMVIGLALVYIFFIRTTSFEVTVKGAPPGSDVLVDNQRLGVTSEDGSIRLINLGAGKRKISIDHPTFTCDARDVTGGNGVTPEPLIARCQEKKVEPGENCDSIGLGEEDKAERCYNTALNALPDPFTPEDLVKALNILIINFDSGKFDVPAKRLAALQKGSNYIKKLPPNIVLEVGGHTDSDGNAASNQSLSESRANAVKQSLVNFGVKGEVLQTKGYGATLPKTDNNTEQGKFYNRRIQYSIVKR